MVSSLPHQLTEWEERIFEIKLAQKLLLITIAVYLFYIYGSVHCIRNLYLKSVWYKPKCLSH
jgi:formate/nitrite transporter FocA (FNT family)